MAQRGIFVKQSGVWKTVLIPYTKISGVWTPILKGFVKKNGVWEQYYPSTGFKSYSTPGTYSWTVPAGVYIINVTLVGAGGGGAGGFGEGQTNNNYYTPGSGGGAGDTQILTISCNPADPVSIIVGRGGTGGALSNYEFTYAGSGTNGESTVITVAGKSYTAAGGGGAAGGRKDLTSVAGAGAGNGASGVSAGGPYTPTYTLFSSTYPAWKAGGAGGNSQYGGTGGVGGTYIPYTNGGNGGIGAGGGGGTGAVINSDEGTGSNGGPGGNGFAQISW